MDLIGSKLYMTRAKLGINGEEYCVVSTIRLTAPMAYATKTIDPRREVMNA